MAENLTYFFIEIVQEGGEEVLFDLSIVMYEYTEILTGKRKNYSDNFFKGNKIEGEKNAILFIRAVANTFLQCHSLEVALATITPQVLKQMKLDVIASNIKRPRFVVAQDRNEYVLTKIFSENMDQEKWIANRLCMRVLDKSLVKFPKSYMEGEEGLKRSQYCLRYFLMDAFPNTEISDLYRISTTPEFTKFLQDRLLLNVRMKMYDSPVEYLHASLPDEAKDDALFHMYEVLYFVNRPNSQVEHQKKNLLQ